MDENKREQPAVAGEPRRERCTICYAKVEDWVDPDWANGRICRKCESLYDPERRGAAADDYETRGSNAEGVRSSARVGGSAEKDAVIKAAVALIASIRPWDANDQRIPIWRNFVERLREAVRALPPTDQTEAPRRETVVA